jgi:hypothetical protein
VPDIGTEQRKLAAIMFTDMVGYSALAQCNETWARAGRRMRLLSQACDLPLLLLVVLLFALLRATSFVSLECWNFRLSHSKK